MNLPSDLTTFQEKDKVKLQTIKETLLAEIPLIMLNNFVRRSQHIKFFHSYYNKFVVIAGGCFTSLYHDEDPRDIDIYLLHGQANAAAMTEEESKLGGDMLVTLHNNREVRTVATNYLKNPHIRAVYEYNCSGPRSLGGINLKLNIMETDYHTREEMLKDFDLMHACAAIHNRSLSISPATHYLIKNKLLARNSLQVFPSEKRIKKLMDRGFSPVGQDVEKHLFLHKFGKEEHDAFGKHTIRNYLHTSNAAHTHTISINHINNSNKNSTFTTLIEDDLSFLDAGPTTTGQFTLNTVTNGYTSIQEEIDKIVTEKTKEIMDRITKTESATIKPVEFEKPTLGQTFRNLLNKMKYI